LRSGRAAAVAVAAAIGGGCGDDGPVPPPRAVEVRASGCSLADELAVGAPIGDGLVLTVGHVLRGASGVTVDGRRGEVVALDHRIDAGLVAVDLDAPRAHFSSAPSTGVVTLPDGPALLIDVVDANVDEPRDGTTHRRRALVLSADVVKGESGSLVLAPDSSILGMVFATSTGRHNVAYAVSSTELKPFVNAGRVAAGPVDTGDCRGQD